MAETVSNEASSGGNSIYLVVLLIVAVLILVLLKKGLQVWQKKKEKDAFWDNVRRAYQNADKAYALLSEQSEVPFTQAEMAMMQLALQGYADCRAQLDRGSVSLDIAARLDSVANRMNELNRARLSRAGRASSNAGRKKSQQRTQTSSEAPENDVRQDGDRPLVYFRGCTTVEDAKTRYRNLCRSFHPDTGTGDTEAFEDMKQEYELVMESLSGAARQKKKRK